MRKQHTQVYTERKKRTLILLAAVVAVIGMAVLFAHSFYKAKNPVYEPPTFDKTAQEGVPEPDESMGYSDISADGGFGFSMAGVLYQQENGELQLYFTNPKDSNVNMLCEVLNKKGETLYKTGAVRPGEYVKEVSPERKIKNEATNITINVYAFEPDTWYSKGTITLENVLQPY